MHSIRTAAYTSFRIDENATDLSIRLWQGLGETIFTINQPIDAKERAHIGRALSDYKKATSHYAHPIA